MRRTMVASLATVMLLGSVPFSAGAQSMSLAELQAKIAQLQAQIAALQGTTTNTALPAYSWSTPLRLGSTGPAVTELQRFLNSSPDTVVSLSGAGSAGNETAYYGPATAAAVSKFQVKYRADILTPSGLSAPTGYFGLLSIAKANSLRNMPTTPTNPTKPTNPTNPSAPDSLSGEGQLQSFRLQEADDTDIKEAADSAIGEITLEASDGDIRITRMDIALVADSDNTEKDPWDTFDSMSLWIDGKRIAEKDIDTKRDYLNDKQGTIRFSNIDIIAEEDEEVEIKVMVAVKNNIKGADTAANWSLKADALRYFDADQVSTDDRTTGDLGDSVQFSIVNRGDGEELKFSLGNRNPEASTIIVDTDRRTNNVTILEYDIEAIDSDIELDSLAINIETGTAAYNDVVNAVRLVIDGKTFRSQSITTTGAYSTTSVLAVFNIDNKITIDADDVETVKVVVDFKAPTNYGNGENIRARVTSTERNLTKAEGSDDVSDFSGTAIGNIHDLVAEGISVNRDTVKFTTDTIGTNATIGTFNIEFKVTAIEGDYYIKRFASTTTDASNGGVQFEIVGGNDIDSVTASLSSSAREDGNGTYVVRDGRTETFTLLVTVDPTVAGQYAVGLEHIIFSTNPNGVTNAQEYKVNPSYLFQTPYKFISN